MIEISRRNPKTARDLQPVRGLPKRHLDAIFEAVERGRALPAEECPHLVQREQDPPQLGLLVNLLAAQLAHLADHMQLAANLVATSQSLRTLVRARIEGTAPPAESLLLQGWRATHILPHLQAMLDGRISLRVGDIENDVPFVFSEN
jgi:ribonuclease D